MVAHRAQHAHLETGFNVTHLEETVFNVTHLEGAGFNLEHLEGTGFNVTHLEQGDGVQRYTPRAGGQGSTLHT